MKANTVYQEVISDRHHIHMNSTIWSTLTNFVQHLGKTGLCKIDKEGDDWYVTYNSTDPREVSQREASKREKVLSQNDEDKDRLLVQKKIKNSITNIKKEKVKKVLNLYHNTRKAFELSS